MSDEARCSINGTDHPWCMSPSRDEAVRAAEDKRPGPLPTLEEAISRAGQFTPQEPPQEPKCTERESGLRTELVTLEVTHRFEDPIARVLLGALDSVLSGQGESVFVMDGSCEITKLTDERDAAIRERDEAIAEPFVEPAKCSPAVSETGETQSGLRTERVTLEVTHSVPVASWDWTNILETYRPGESVRVVDDQREAQRGIIDTLTRLNDAAIRERDESKQRADRDAVKCIALADKVIGLKARVASLESQLESVACRAATAENRVAELECAAKAAPAASGAAGTEGERQPIDLDDLQRVAARVRLQLDDNWLADMAELACDEIDRLREERRQREALWQVCADHTRRVYGNVFVPKPLPPEPEPKEPNRE